MLPIIMPERIIISLHIGLGNRTFDCLASCVRSAVQVGISKVPYLTRPDPPHILGSPIEFL